MMTKLRRLPLVPFAWLLVGVILGAQLTFIQNLGKSGSGHQDRLETAQIVEPREVQRESSQRSSEQVPSEESKKLRLAIVMTGRLNSLSFNSTARAWGKAFQKPPAEWPTIQKDFGRLVKNAGARLVQMDIHEQFKIAQIDEVDRMYQWKTDKMKGQKCATYQQHYNKYHGFRLVLQEELRLDKHYDFVMFVREDSLWLSEMKPIHFFDQSAVSVKDCLSFGGINDKSSAIDRTLSAVVPRRFASPWFDILVQNYLYIITRYKNPEDMAKKNAEAAKVPIVKVPVEWLPQLDIRNVETTVSPEGRLQQDFRSGCFHPLYAGGRTLEPDDKECACVPKQWCARVKQRYCPFTKDKS